MMNTVNNYLEVTANNIREEKDLEDILEQCALEGFKCPEIKISFSEVSVDDVLSAVASFRNQSVNDIKSKSRKRELVYSRFLYSMFCLIILKDYRNRKDLTLENIGLLIDKDHSMILHYKKDYKRFIELFETFPTSTNRRNIEKIHNELAKIENIIETKLQDEYRTKNS